MVQLLTVVGRTTDERALSPGRGRHRERLPRAPRRLGDRRRGRSRPASSPSAGSSHRAPPGSRSPRPPSGGATAPPSCATAPSTGSPSPARTTRCRPPSEPGWLFAEQSAGIAAQLNYGVRALLVKTHYGIPSPIDVTGANLVVTDRAAELAANPKAVEQSLPPGSSAASAEQAQKLAASAGIDPAKRDVYLCHVYCEYGATKLSAVLADIKLFLDQNPDEVILFFVGDYVRPGRHRAGVPRRRPLRPHLPLRPHPAAPDAGPDDRRRPEHRPALGVHRAAPGVEHARLRDLPGHAVHVHRARPAAGRGRARLHRRHHLRHRPGERHARRARRGARRPARPCRSPRTGPAPRAAPPTAAPPTRRCSRSTTGSPRPARPPPWPRRSRSTPTTC